MNLQIARNMALAGLPVAICTERFTGILSLRPNGKHALDVFGGDGKVRRIVSMPQYQVKTRKKYERVNGRCVTIKLTAV